MAAAGSLASSGPKRVMKGRFEPRRMTIYYRRIANGSRPAAGPQSRAPCMIIAPRLRHPWRRPFVMKYDRRAEAIRAHSVPTGVQYASRWGSLLLGCCSVGESKQTGVGMVEHLQARKRGFDRRHIPGYQSIARTPERRIPDPRITHSLSGNTGHRPDCHGDCRTACTARCR